MQKKWEPSLLFVPYNKKGSKIMIRTKLIKSALIACSLFLLSACGGENISAENQAREIPEEQVNGTESTPVKLTISKQDVETFDHPSADLQNQVKGMLTHYLSLKKSLVESSAEGASEAAGKLLANIKEFDSNKLPDEQKSFYKKRANKMDKSVRFIAENKALEEQRGHFSAITAEMYKLLKASKANEESLYYQYCPMAFNNNGSYWLSDSKEVLNPYFGEKMLKCGRVAETIQH